MGIPLEYARGFVAAVNDAREYERRVFRWDIASFVVLAGAIGVNGVLAAQGGGAVSVATVCLLAFIAGMKAVRVSDRRASYHRLVAGAEEAETALAFAELDEAS